MPRRDLELARAAYGLHRIPEHEERAAELSRRAHAQTPIHAEFDLIGNPIGPPPNPIENPIVPASLPGRASEDHNGESNDYIRNLYFGGLHGWITSLAIVSASYATDVDSSATSVLCIANIFANALTIGLGEYISRSTEREVAGEEYNREKWEMQNYPEGEVQEMVQLYQEKHGFSQEDAQTIIETMAKYEKFFLDHMMHVELGLRSPEEKNDIWIHASIMVFSVLAFGIMPMAAQQYLHAVYPDSSLMAYPFGMLLPTCIIIFALGYGKAVLSRQPRLRSSLRMVVQYGGMATVAAYGLGRAIALLCL
jgi:DNA damage-binding protein 1